MTLLPMLLRSVLLLPLLLRVLLLFVGLRTGLLLLHMRLLPLLLRPALARLLVRGRALWFNPAVLCWLCGPRLMGGLHALAIHVAMLTRTLRLPTVLRLCGLMRCSWRMIAVLQDVLLHTRACTLICLLPVHLLRLVRRTRMRASLSVVEAGPSRRPTLHGTRMLRTCAINDWPQVCGVRIFGGPAGEPVVGHKSGWPEVCAAVEELALVRAGLLYMLLPGREWRRSAARARQPVQTGVAACQHRHGRRYRKRCC